MFLLRTVPQKSRRISLSITIATIRLHLLSSNAKKKMFLSKNLHKLPIRLFRMLTLLQELSNMYGLHQESKMHISSLIKKAVLGKLFPISLSTVLKSLVPTNMPIMVALQQVANNCFLSQKLLKAN